MKKQSFLPFFGLLDMLLFFRTKRFQAELFLFFCFFLFGVFWRLDCFKRNENFEAVCPLSSLQAVLLPVQYCHREHYKTKFLIYRCTFYGRYVVKYCKVWFLTGVLQDLYRVLQVFFFFSKRKKFQNQYGESFLLVEEGCKDCFLLLQGKGYEIHWKYWYLTLSSEKEKSN